jgi:hypothetical protein
MVFGVTSSYDWFSNSFTEIGKVETLGVALKNIYDLIISEGIFFALFGMATMHLINSNASSQPQESDKIVGGEREAEDEAE